MTAYLARRLLLGCVNLLLISFVVYGLIRALPGDPAFVLGLESDSPATRRQLDEMRAAFGLDEPWIAAYFHWLGRTLSGDLGNSLHRHSPVSAAILEAVGPTLLLSVTSLGIAYLISIPLGVYSAHRSGRPDERLLSAALYVLYSFPSYVVALFLLLVFSVKLGWLPLFGMTSLGHEDLPWHLKAWDVARHMVLPVTCYTYGSLAFYARFIRSNMAEVLQQDYIRTARAKGLPERTVLWRHGFRNTLIPFVTLVGLSVPGLLGGSVILERIFLWPGMGKLFYDALSTRDYPLIMAVTMMFSALVVLGTLLADLLYAVVDPRVSFR